MPVARLTQKYADDAPEGAYWDTELKGFGLIVRATGTKSWVVQKSGKKRWTLGRHPVMTVAEARRRARQVIIDRPEPMAQITLAEALQSHTTRMVRKGQARSLPLLRGEVEAHLSDWLNKPLAEITRGMCEARHNRIGKRGEQLANRVMRHFRAIYNTALKKVDLPTNPTIAVEWFGNTRRQYDRIPLAAFHEAVAELDDPLRRAWYLTALSTGLRKTDCASLCWEDVDFAGMNIHRPNPKGGRAFDLPMSQQTAAVLKAISPGRAGWVFPSNRSKTGYMSSQRDLPWNPHHFRAEYISLATDVGVPTYPKKLLVNHAVPRADVTDGYVARPDIEMCRPWQDKISERIFG